MGTVYDILTYYISAREVIVRNKLTTFGFHYEALNWQGTTRSDVLYLIKLLYCASYIETHGTFIIK